ncbi:MAG: hypothetical protein ACE5H0_08320 [Bacteroidota bacterium]
MHDVVHLVMLAIDSSLQRIGLIFLTASFSFLLGGCGGPLTGIITSTEKNGIVISVGQADGVREGDIFWVWREEAVPNGGVVTVRVGIIRIVKILGKHTALGELFYGKAEAGQQAQRVEGGGR